MEKSKLSIPEIQIEDYNYELPEEKIAKYPLEQRDHSKLLVYKDNQISAGNFPSIVDVLPANGLLLFNNTKVIRARLPFNKATGAKIEIFCLEPHNPAEVAIAFEQKEKVAWNCIIGNLKKWKNGSLLKTVEIDNTTIEVTAERNGINGEAHIVEFSWNNTRFSFSEIIDAIGKTPIPPYLNREAEDIDTDRYQTVFSEHKGSVAAPTAGLHFTESILKQLKAKGLKQSFLTLHVGAGTFKPVKTAMVSQHEMHIENFTVELSTIENLLNHQGPYISIGTTSVRTIESLYWLGVKLLQGINEFHVNQWDPYQLPSHFSHKEALQAIHDKLVAEKRHFISSYTGIIIVPGYQFKIINILITNFHQPQSTLLLLVAALVGTEKWKEIYAFALENNFRFLSYGDSSVLFGNQ